MNDVKVIEGDMRATGAKVAVVVARFNSYIVESLLRGALDTLQRSGVAADDLLIVRVPGAFELPLAAAKLAASQRYQGIVALGCVIRGATPHFDYVAGECSKGLAQVALTHSIPVGFGVLTTDTIEQAIERAGTKAGNKGADAAATVVEMLNLMQKL